MGIKLENYQEKAVKDLSELVDKKIALNKENDNQVYLKAVTGAGKTVIMGAYLKEAIKLHPEYKFLWFCPGKGGLAEQSYQSLSSYMTGVNVRLLDDRSKLHDEEPQKNTLYVVNWEKIWSDKTNFMKKGDSKSFIEFVNAAKNSNSNNKIVFVIDEAHIGEKSSDVVEFDRGISRIKTEIDVDLFINVTATPKSNRDDNIVIVDIQDVKKSGRIKQGIRFSHNFDVNIEGDSIWEKILVTAIKQRNDLVEKYKQLNCEINPLCLIQIPNKSKKSEDEDGVNIVLDILKKQGHTREDGSVSVYLTNDKDADMNILKQNNNSVSYIICKEGITLGWDCPRAQILVCFRDSKSITFNLQTVGRILRMPYGDKIEKNSNHLFDIDDLNYAYVYSDNSCQIDPYLQNSEMSYVSQILRDDTVKIADKTISIIEDVKSVKLNRIKKKSVSEKIRDFVLISKINSYLNENMRYINKEYKNVIGFVVNGNISVEDIQNKVANKNLSFNLETLDVERRYNYWLAGLNCPYFSSKTLNDILFEYFENYISDYIETEYKDKYLTLSIRKLIYNNKELIEKMLDGIKNEKKKELDLLTSYDNEDYTFEVQRYGKELSSKENWTHSAYTNQRIEKGGSSREEFFESYLDSKLAELPDDNSRKVAWWIKNVDVNGFSISYMEHNENGEELGLRGFNPDYVVRFSNGDLGLYEVKSSEDNSSNIEDKELALKEYVEKLQKEYSDIKVYGAIVRITKDGRNDLVDLPKI